MELARRWAFAGTLAAVTAGAACAALAPIREAFEDPTPHERYAASLQDAGLDATALGREWLAAAERALHEPYEVDPPYQGVGYLAAERPSAAAYQVALRRGQRLEVEVEWTSAEPGIGFVDLFHVEARAESTTFRHVVSADTADGRLELEVPGDGLYLVRLQTELLRGARYRLTLLTAPILGFPVHGHDVRSIRSAFGDPRDGGAREHHGVDIFAPRGTPVLAATQGRVTRVGTNRLGGRVVWLRDEVRGLRLYYAHLDRQLVEGGERVGAGDTLGLVGNSGNAVTTPPHLHFGVYVRGVGPLDPRPFVYPTSRELPPLQVEAERLGTWLRTSVRTNLRPRPVAAGEPSATLDPHTPLRATGATGEWYRVELPDGRRGFAFGPLLQPVEDPVEVRTLAERQPFLDRPGPTGIAIDTVPEGTPVEVLGAFEGYLLASHAPWGTGWLGDAAP